MTKYDEFYLLETGDTHASIDFSEMLSAQL
jgi:hypothetical protein